MLNSCKCPNTQLTNGNVKVLTILFWGGRTPLPFAQIPGLRVNIIEGNV